MIRKMSAKLKEWKDYFINDKKLIPDKGWCWVMFFASCVLMFMVFGVHYTYGILYPNLLKEFKRGEGQTAWVGSLSSGLLFLSSTLAIKCCDVTSVSTTLMLGAILSGTGLILTSIVQDFFALYFVYGVFFGVGTSLLYTPCLVMIGRWFKKYQAVTTGLAVASSALGAVVMCPLIQHIIIVNGLRRAIRMCGIAYLTIAGLCALCFKPFSKTTNESSTDTKLKDHASECLTDESHITDSEHDFKDNFTVNWTLFRSKKYVVFLIAMMLTNFAYYIPIIHLVNYATHNLQISPTNASFLISIWSISNIIGRMVYGKIISCVREHLIIVYQFSMFLSGVVSILTYFATSHWSLVSYVIAYGFLDGSFIGLLSLVTLDIVGARDFAQGYGIMLTSIGIPIAVGPPIIGMMNDSKLLQPQFMFVLAGSLFVIGSILINFTRMWHNQDLAQKNSFLITNIQDEVKEPVKNTETENLWFVTNV
ncbi:monocarboxylate transporter 10-like [Clytia hemisphaerica]